MKYIIYLIIGIVILSCSEDKSKTVIQTQDEAKRLVTKVEMVTEEKAENETEDEKQRKLVDFKEEPQLQLDSVRLRFKEIELTVGLEEVWSEEEYFEMVHNDTIRIEMGLASKIAGHTYTISRIDSSIQKIKILQNYETSLTLMNEGPHLDLTEWKHYYSDWVDLKVEDKTFTTIDYPIEDWEEFPEVTTNEIVQAVKEKLDEESSGWIELAQKCTGANEYPCGVSISRINLRFIMTDKDGNQSEKIIIYEIPMGC